MPKRESRNAKIERENKMHDRCEETEQISIVDGTITFIRLFKHLGSSLSHDLQDDIEMSMRIANASCAIGKLHSFWKCDEVELHSKCLIFMAIPLNLLLWGCESWALKESLIKSLDVFLHRSIRRILGTSMLEVR